MPKYKYNIFTAASRGQDWPVQSMIDSGVDISKRNSYRQTPLMVGAEHGRKDVVAVLIDNGANIDASDVNGNTALLLAARGQHREVVRLLLARGADAEASNEVGHRALHLAARQGDLPTVQLLLAELVDMEAKDYNGKTAIMLARDAGHYDVVKELCKGKETNDNDGESDGASSSYGSSPMPRNQSTWGSVVAWNQGPVSYSTRNQGIFGTLPTRNQGIFGTPPTRNQGIIGTLPTYNPFEGIVLPPTRNQGIIGTLPTYNPFEGIILPPPRNPIQGIDLPPISFTGHRLSINEIDFSKDGKFVVSCSKDGTLKVWEISTGNEVATIDIVAPISTVSFSPNDELLAFGSDFGIITLWNTRTRAEVRRLTGHTGAIVKLKFLQIGQIVSTSLDNTLRVWDTSTGNETKKLTIQGLERRICAIGRYLVASATFHGMISVRETACGTLQAALSHEPSVVGVAFSPLDENLFVSISSHTMTVWDLRPIGTMARAIRTVSGFPEGCSCVEFSPDGKMLAVGGSNDNITVWETDTWNRIATVAGKLGEIHSLRFSPDAKLIASGDIGGKLQVREIPSNPNALVGQSTYARGWASTRIF